MKAINVITLALILLSVFCYSYIPVEYRSFIYALSLLIKDVILMVLPFIIFSFLLNTIVELRAKAIVLLLVFLVLIMISNSIAVIIAYYVSSNFLTTISSASSGGDLVEPLQPLWQLNIPQFLSPQEAVIASVVIGFAMISLFKNNAAAINRIFYSTSEMVLQKMIMPVVPIFVAGFIIKICNDQMLKPIFTHYSYIFLLIAGSGFLYITLVYLLLTGKAFFIVLANMFPPLVTGFSTMSSAITLPSLITAAEKNTNNSKAATSILPPSVNFHLIGDAFTITTCFVFITFTFTGKALTFMEFLPYIAYFLSLRLSNLGIPGGGIFVLQSALLHHLGFSPEMAALITTLYIMFEPMNTAMNIYGNGAFAIFFSKIYKNR